METIILKATLSIYVGKNEWKRIFVIENNTVCECPSDFFLQLLKVFSQPEAFALSQNFSPQADNLFPPLLLLMFSPPSDESAIIDVFI